MGYPRNKLIVLAAIGVTSMPLAGAARQGDAASPVPRLEVKTGSYSEHDGLALGSAGASGGEILVDLPSETAGVLLGDRELRSGFPLIYVSGLAASDRLLCLTINSADGFYDSSAEVVVTPQARRSGRATILLPSKSARLKALMAGHIGVLVRASKRPTGCGIDDDVLAYSWGAVRPDAVNEPQILLAGGGSAYRPNVRYIDQDRPQPCEELKSDNSSLAGFRWVCVPATAPCRPDSRLLIGWRRAGKPIDGPRLRVRRNCP